MDDAETSEEHPPPATSRARIRLRRLAWIAFGYALLSAILGAVLLPALLFYPPLPGRTAGERTRIQASLATGDRRWISAQVIGGEGIALDIAWLHKSDARGVVILLHGFGDDGWGPAGNAQHFPDWDVVTFTFRARDIDAHPPCTLGGWERADVTAIVAYLEQNGTPRSKIVLMGASQGAGVALLALSDLEHTGAPLGGALLESPFRDLRTASRDRVSLVLGPAAAVLWPAIEFGLLRGGHSAHFDARHLSPLDASNGLHTPVAIITGDADTHTPLVGVRDFAQYIPDFTVVQGAGHMEASSKIPGGHHAWIHTRLVRWGLEPKP